MLAYIVQRDKQHNKEKSDLMQKIKQLEEKTLQHEAQQVTV